MSILSPLSQGFGICRPDGVILIPEASGSNPGYKVKNAEGSQVYGHFVPVPKTYLTRRGDIILFTENACDIIYLERMYTKKIRQLYEQQIKTVEDLNRSILFYGSKNPGEYSLNLIRGKFGNERDIAVQPGHLPTHYLHSLTRRIKLSSVVRPRAPPGTGTANTPRVVDPTVKNIALHGSDMDGSDSETDDVNNYRGKHPTPIDMNKLPPIIQHSQRYEPRRKAGSISPRLNKIELNAEVLGLHGTQALPYKQTSQIPSLPTVVTGVATKGHDKDDWQKLGNIIRSIRSVKEPEQGDVPPKIVDEYNRPVAPAFRSMMAMDIQMLKEKRRTINVSHAGVYLTELERDGVWRNEDVPVYVTPDGKVFISSVIISQPVCSQNGVKFSDQDDADEVHNKPEEGSVTFCLGELSGWVKFPGHPGINIRGRRWDPRQTGHYVVEQKVEGEWELLSLNLSIMLGGKVTANEDPVYNPQFEENGVKLNLSADQLEGDGKILVASFDPNCTEFLGKRTSNMAVVLDTYLHCKIEEKYSEVEIRGRKWNPAIAGHYYCQQSTPDGWKNIYLPLEITENAALVLGQEKLGLPLYNGNVMEMDGILHGHLPDKIAVTFLDGKFVGTMWKKKKKEDDEIERVDIRGVRWDPGMAGRYSTQEHTENTWLNTGKTLGIAPDGSIEYGGSRISEGFIVDNKVFVVEENGLDNFFDNTGPISDTNLSGRSFLMQEGTPTYISGLDKQGKLSSDATKPTQQLSTPDTSPIEKAEIVFSSNRCYGHITDSDSDKHKEIRGYKWNDKIVGDYYTQIAKEGGGWNSGPKITITNEGAVKVNDTKIGDILIKDNIVSINNIKAPELSGVKHCLVAIQDRSLTGWLQTDSNSPKIQIRGSVWREGPGTHGTYLTAEKRGDDWISSEKSVIVTPSNKVRISDLDLEGDMSGVSARLGPTLAASDAAELHRLGPTSTPSDAAELHFERDTFSGWVQQDGTKTEIAGFKFDFTPGVYLLESKPSGGADDVWRGLNLQLVVSENGRVSLGGEAVKNMRAEDESLYFDSFSALQNVGMNFNERTVSGTAELEEEDTEPVQVDIRGHMWVPKIAGRYDTELFSPDSGWKPAKRLEVTPQGQVRYGNDLADGVMLDTDTMSFATGGTLKDGTLAFDSTGFSGNVITSRDNKSRVIRGKRVGTRPVSALSGTELTLDADEEDEHFEDLNGQIGSKISRSPGADYTGVDPIGGAGITSDYGSASDMVPHQMSGSRTEVLSSLEEDTSCSDTDPKSEKVTFGDASPSGKPHSPLHSNQRRSPSLPTPSNRNSSPQQNSSSLSHESGRVSSTSSKLETPRQDVDIADIDISLEVHGGDNSDAGGKASVASKLSVDSTHGRKSGVYDNKGDVDDKLDGNLDGDAKIRADSKHSVGGNKSADENLSGAVDDGADVQGVASESWPAADTKDREMKLNVGFPRSSSRVEEGSDSPAQQKQSISYEEKEKTSDTTAVSNRDVTSKTPSKTPSSSQKGPSKTPSDDSKTPGIPEKVTRTPLPEIPKKTLQKPALTKPVKLPGIEMKEKGGAAEITDDAGLLKNYTVPKQNKPKKKKKMKPRPPKKTEASPSSQEVTTSSPVSSQSEVSIQPTPTKEERVKAGIDQALARRSITPSSKTPVHMSTIDRDSSRDTSPLSSGYSTPVIGALPQREFQGALMAAKKTRETTDQQLDGKIPSDIREHPVAEEVAAKFGMEMKVRDPSDENKMSVKERRELARQRKKDEAERKRRERDDDKRKGKEEEERLLAEEEAMKQRRAEREAELTAQRERELQRRKEEEQKRRQARLDERDKKKREEDKMMDAKKRLEEELKRRREAEAARLAEIERQKQLALEKEREEHEKLVAEAELIRTRMEEEMARELAEYEKKVREEDARRRIEDALKAEAERRLLDEEERRRIIALARHLWNKGVRIEGDNLDQELEISSIFYSYFNYLHSEEPFNPQVDFTLREKLDKLGRSQTDKV